jgi:hypothetical protein
MALPLKAALFVLPRLSLARKDLLVPTLLQAVEIAGNSLPFYRDPSCLHRGVFYWHYSHFKKGNKKPPLEETVLRFISGKT